MNAFKITVTLIGMHLIGSAILFSYISGPSAILAAPILSVFGWFLIFPEAIGLGLIWFLYKPNSKPGWVRKIYFGLLFGVIGALTAAFLVPKEQNNELDYWIASLLAGSGAAVFSFVCIHIIKISKLLNPEPEGEIERI